LNEQIVKLIYMMSLLGRGKPILADMALRKWYGQERG